MRRNYNGLALVEIPTRKYFCIPLFGTIQTRVEYTRAENWVGQLVQFIGRQKANGDLLAIVESAAVRCVCFTAGIWCLGYASEIVAQGLAFERLRTRLPEASWPCLGRYD